MLLCIEGIGIGVILQLSCQVMSRFLPGIGTHSFTIFHEISGHFLQLEPASTLHLFFDPPLRFNPFLLGGQRQHAYGM